MNVNVNGCVNGNGNVDLSMLGVAFCDWDFGCVDWYILELYSYP